MKKKYLLIILCLVLIGAGIVVLLFTKTTSISYHYVPEKINEPIVSLLESYGNMLEVEAGIYYYGDVNFDGIINDSDIQAIDMIIASSISFDETELASADLNHDNKIDSKDKKILQNYLDDVGEYKYNPNESKILYCISKVNESDNCTWIENNSFDLIDETTYYIFVKDSDTNIISKYQQYIYENFDEGYYNNHGDEITDDIIEEIEEE